MSQFIYLYALSTHGNFKHHLSFSPLQIQSKGITHAQVWVCGCVEGDEKIDYVKSNREGTSQG